VKQQRKPARLVEPSMKALQEAARRIVQPLRTLPASWWNLTEEETLNMKGRVEQHERQGD
jgi:hypothetical protein